MDNIDHAIKKGKHISGIPWLDAQTWEAFEEAATGKQIILYGVGAAAFLFWQRSNWGNAVAEIIDNSLALHGKPAIDVLPEVLFSRKTDLLIADHSVLREYSPDNTVILIMSVNYYKNIALQLVEEGFSEVYSLMVMEARYRNEYKGKYFPIGHKFLVDDYIRRFKQLPIENRKVLFWTSGTYCDHGKYITEQLLKMQKDIQIVWELSDINETLPDGIVKVSYGANWKRYLYELATTHIFLLNSDLPQELLKIKRPGQVYIQTKHWASVTLKKFYLDASNITRIASRAELIRRNCEHLDYIFSGSDFDEDSCRRGFNFHKTFVRVGSPRSDAMFRQNEMRQKIQRAFRLKASDKLLLYAPTYRYQKDIKDRNVFEIRELDMDFDAVRTALVNRFGGTWQILLRLHPGLEDQVDRVLRPEYVLDVSRYPDGEELAAACDVMVSDYSSIMFEPAFVKKPVFLLALDKKDYVNREYDLLIDYDTLPFPIAESNEQLVDHIMNFDQTKYECDVDAFLEKYGVHEDGHASERAAKFILDLMDGKIQEIAPNNHGYS